MKKTNAVTATKTTRKLPVKTAAKVAVKAAGPTKAAAAKLPAAMLEDAKAPATPAKKQRKPTPSDKPVVELKEKTRKPKLVRDSFTMPEVEYAVLGEVKKACLKAGIEVKKSELLRVGVALLKQLDLAALMSVLDSLPALKAGRPKKSK